MEKIKIEKLYNELGDSNINELYYYSCLLCSGFDKDTAYELIDTLNSVWLKDETDTNIGRLSDMLYEVYDDIKDKMQDMSDRQILLAMFNGGYDEDDDEYYDEV